MALINWNGTQLRARPIRRQATGLWEMEALDHAPRVQPGTIISVRESEIVGWEVGNAMVPPPGGGAPAGDTILDEVYGATGYRRDKSKSTSTPMHHTPKLNSLHDAFAGFTKRVEAAADKLHQRMDKAAGHTENAIDKFTAGVAAVEATAKQIDDAANQMSNGGPPLEGSPNSQG